MSQVTAETVVEAVSVTKSIAGPQGPIKILQTVDLRITPGESIAVVGASGSGKSTLLSLLAGLDMPTTGTVQLLGQTLTSLDEDDRAALRAGRVGFVFQSFQLMAGLTALENVMLPLELAGKRHHARNHAEDALTQVGLAHRLHHERSQLSGGEQQRVAIARAFVTRPAILFADEPTGNLDQATGERVIDLLLAQREAHGTALVLVTHDPGLAGRCSRRLQLDHGQLVTP